MQEHSGERLARGLVNSAKSVCEDFEDVELQHLVVILKLADEEQAAAVQYLRDGHRLGDELQGAMMMAALVDTLDATARSLGIPIDDMVEKLAEDMQRRTKAVRPLARRRRRGDVRRGRGR